MASAQPLPRLPAQAVREALDAEAWDTAGALISAFQAEVSTALAATDLATVPRAPWVDLVTQQRALLDELTRRREAAAAALAQIASNRRAVKAWAKALA